jgi:uncharacterized coiled-coil protein SlyX
LDRHVAINSIIEGLSRLVTEARFYIEHLQMQLNMLTLGHLSFKSTGIGRLNGLKI